VPACLALELYEAANMVFKGKDKITRVKKISGDVGFITTGGNACAL
jgi:hypothetical protein